MFAGYRRKSHNFSLDRQVKPLVLPSEIMGLKNLTGYSEIRELHRPDPVRTESRAAAPTGIRPSSDQERRFASERQTRPTDRVSAAGQRRPASSRKQQRVGSRPRGFGGRADSVLRLMLTISRPLSSGQAQRYHAEEFTSRAQSYYAEAENVRGEWQGRLATDLGLKGDVRAEDFATDV